MRTRLMLALGLVIIAMLNYSVYQKERLKREGDTLLLELAPVDPRSLMQGDYMRLRYALPAAIPKGDFLENTKRGHMVIKADEHGVAQYVRVHRGEVLNDNEQLLKFIKRHRVEIVPNAFFFQEGHAKYYEEAKYGVFKIDDGGKPLLFGLANTDRALILVE